MKGARGEGKDPVSPRGFMENTHSLLMIAAHQSPLLGLFMCANCQLKSSRQWIVLSITLVTIWCRQKTMEKDKEAKCQVFPRPNSNNLRKQKKLFSSQTELAAQNQLFLLRQL